MVQLDFSSVDHDPTFKYNSRILASLVTDIFLQFMEDGVHSISQNEILRILGVNEKAIDIHDVVIYDLKTITKGLKNFDKAALYDTIENRIGNIDFDNREFA